MTPRSDPHPAPADAPVVGVPGLGLSAATLEPVLRGLSGATGVVVLPGFGRSASLRVPVDPPTQADRLLDHLARHGPDRSVLVGHSASCQVVAEAAARAPDVVAALVLIGPTTDPRARTRSRLGARWVRTAGHEHPAQIPRLVLDYTRTGPVGMTRTMGAARRHRIETPLLAATCPVLVLRGRRDRISPRDWTETLARITPRGTAVTLAAGAHMVPLTHPAAVVEAVARFLRHAAAPGAGPRAAPG